MARKDVINYFLEVQMQYITMSKNIKEIDYAVKHNMLEQDRLEQAIKQVEIIKSNYERLAYIVMLLNQPNKKSKKPEELKRNQKLYNYLKGASKEAVLDENRDALCDLKKIIDETKKEENDDK